MLVLARRREHLGDLRAGDIGRKRPARADAVMVSQDLRELPRAIAHARRTLAIVGQNVLWAFAYNVLVLPLALSGGLSPWAAALGMSASSLVVALNALRLERPARPSAEAVPARLART